MLSLTETQSESNGGRRPDGGQGTIDLLIIYRSENNPQNQWAALRAAHDLASKKPSSFDIGECAWIRTKGLFIIS